MSISRVIHGTAGLGPFPETSPQSPVTEGSAVVDSVSPIQSFFAFDPSLGAHGNNDPWLTAPAVPENHGSTLESTRTVLAQIKAGEARGDLYAMLSLLLRVSQSQRAAAREERHAGYQAQAMSQYAAAEKVREGADRRMWGSIIASTSQVLGGTVMAVGGGVSMAAGMKAANLSALGQAAGVDAGNAADLAKQTQQWEALSRTATPLGQSVSEITGGGGRFAQSVLEKDASERDAQKIELDASGRKQEQMTQEVNEHMQQQLETIRDVLDKLRSLEQSRQETTRGIARSL